MTKPKTPGTKADKASAKRAREMRLSQALRDNLKRRKSQARKRAPTAEPYPEKTSEPH